MKFLTLSLALSLIAFSQTVAAEKADKDKPAQVEADTVTVDDQKQIQTFTGNVQLKKGSLSVKAAKMEARTDAQGFQMLKAWGDAKQPVVFRQKREGVNEWVEGQALSLEFDGKADIVMLQDQAQLKRLNASNAPLDDVKGATIKYFNQTENFEVKGGASSSFEGGRVKVILAPRTPAKPDEKKAP